MNYIVTEQDERLQMLVSIVRRMKQACNVVVFSEVQVQFLSELFTLMGLEIRVSISANEQGLQVFYDPPIEQVKKGLVFVMTEENITYGTETKLEKNKQAQFVNEEVQKLVSRNYNLNCLAEKAYKDFVYNYQHKLDQSIYDVLKLNPMRLCKAFGFDVTPRLNNFRLKPSTEYVQKKKSEKPAIKKAKKSIKKLVKKQ